jgi:hypothetical protein
MAIVNANVKIVQMAPKIRQPARRNHLWGWGGVLRCGPGGVLGLVVVDPWFNAGGNVNTL